MCLGRFLLYLGLTIIIVIWSMDQYLFSLNTFYDVGVAAGAATKARAPTILLREEGNY